MRQFLIYLEENATELLFAVALVILIYTTSRFLKLPGGAAIALAITPLAFAYGYTSGMLRPLIG